MCIMIVLDSGLTSQGQAPVTAPANGLPHDCLCRSASRIATAAFDSDQEFEDIYKLQDLPVPNFLVNACFGWDLI